VHQNDIKQIICKSTFLIDLGVEEAGAELPYNKLGHGPLYQTQNNIFSINFLSEIVLEIYN
jgi:hypothetical protein